MDWYVYIISNNAHTLYTGMTDNLPRRIYQHKTRTHANAFTARYTFDRLVHFETLPSKLEAAKREQQIKHGGAPNESHSSRRRIPTGSISAFRGLNR
jgi:predicted GIY-YIG superfamily endonuclease